MCSKYSRLCLIVVLLALACSAAQAAVVNVTPSGDKVYNSYDGYEIACTSGWVIDTYHLGYGELCPWGNANSESRTFWNGRPFPGGGYGSFYATCAYYQGTSSADKNPSTVWLGTDQWNGSSLVGKTLGSISEMSYYSLVSNIPQRRPGTPTEKEWWVDNTYTKWAYCQQPILLEITADSPDGTERRSFWYRPWGTGTNYLGIDTGGREGKWENFNCLTQGKWYSPRCADVVADPDAEEYGWGNWATLMASSLKTAFPNDPSGDTPARTAPFSQWKLAPSSGSSGGIMKSPGWHTNSTPVGNPNSNGTGKAINFHVGARYQSTNPLWLSGNVTWVNNTYGFRGHVDRFTLGFDGTSVTYDFEPSPTEQQQRVVAISEKAASDSIALTSYTDRPPANTDYTQKKNRFRISGKVIRSKQGAYISEGKYQMSYFVIDDGSGLKYSERYKVDGNWVIESGLDGSVWVYLAPRADGLSIWNGDYVSADGFMEKMRWAWTPIIMWTSPSHVTNWSDI